MEYRPSGRRKRLNVLNGRDQRQFANQLPLQVEASIDQLKREKPHWGVRKLRELLLRKFKSEVKSLQPLENPFGAFKV